MQFFNGYNTASAVDIRSTWNLLPIQYLRFYPFTCKKRYANRRRMRAPGRNYVRAAGAHKKKCLTHTTPPPKQKWTEKNKKRTYRLMSFHRPKVVHCPFCHAQRGLSARLRASISSEVRHSALQRLNNVHGRVPHKLRGVHGGGDECEPSPTLRITEFSVADPRPPPRRPESAKKEFGSWILCLCALVKAAKYSEHRFTR